MNRAGTRAVATLAVPRSCLVQNLRQAAPKVEADRDHRRSDQERDPPAPDIERRWRYRRDRMDPTTPAIRFARPCDALWSAT